MKNEENSFDDNEQNEENSEQNTDQAVETRFWKERFWKYVNGGAHPGRHPDDDHRFNNDENEYLHNPSPR